VVWKLDRLARSVQHLIEIIEQLNKRGSGFRSLTETIDTTTAGGRLIFHIFGALAEFERNIIRERTMAGLEAARSRGRKGGRPKLMNDESNCRASVAKNWGLDGKRYCEADRCMRTDPLQISAQSPEHLEGPSLLRREMLALALNL
jgi:hypothetical protein